MKTIFLVGLFSSLMLVMFGCAGSAVGTLGQGFCDKDADCVPFPECHPKTCIHKDLTELYIPPEACTMQFEEEAAYSPSDCACVESVCINKNAKNNTNESIFGIVGLE